MQRPRRCASALILTVFLAAFVATPLAAAKSIDQWRQRWYETSRSIKQVQDKLRPLKKKQEGATHELAAAERRLAITRTTLRDIESQLRNTKYKLAQTRAELEKVENRLKEGNELLAARLADTYKHGSVSYLSILLGAGDFWDLVSRGYVIQKVLQSDVELIETIKDDKRAVEEYKEILEEQEERGTALEWKQAGVTRAAYEQTKERKQILGNITSERTKYEQMLAELQKDSQDISAMIRKMQQTPAGHKRLGQVWRGSFTAPVQGRITSEFGMRFHPILGGRRMHTGVDIGAPHGTTIKAAAGGVVVYTGWRKAYGNTVVIDHGGDVISFYGHCSSFLIRNGDAVKQGQPIARVGTTGLSTGPHVHFEVQKNAVPVSPL